MSIIEQIFKSPEGGTARRNGSERPLPQDGFWVGGIVSPLVIDDLSNPGAFEEIDFFLDYLITQALAEFVGWWTDTETGKVYVDAVSWQGTEFLARRLGRARSEIAVFDIAKQEEVRL